MEFATTVHAGMRFLSGQVEEVGLDTGICVHNVSYRNTHDWIEKTNRYTAAPDRSVAPGYSPDHGLRAYIEDRAAHWFGQTAGHTLYVDAVSALRVVYDIVDVVKSLESTIGVDVDSDFAAITRSLSQELDGFLTSAKSATSAVAAGEPSDRLTGAARLDDPTGAAVEPLSPERGDRQYTIPDPIAPPPPPVWPGGSA